jgi:hypothetical protein
VPQGGLVRITGAAPGCAAGNEVFVISRAFSRVHEFAGVPAAVAKVRAGGRFSASARIPRSRAPGNYALTARCGGGQSRSLKDADRPPGVTAGLQLLVSARDSRGAPLAGETLRMAFGAEGLDGVGRQP